MNTKRDMYYNRVMDSSLEEIIMENYNWLIEAVKNNPELDFQTGSNKGNSWFSIYRGTGRLLTVKKTGKITADKEYIKRYPEFYNNPTLENFASLLFEVQNDKKFDRYYISGDDKKEGFYQNLISRRYTLNCKDSDDFIIVDKEFVIGYEKEEFKNEILKPIKEKYDGFISTIKQAHPNWCKNIKQTGEECDFLALNRDGDIILLELKRYNDSTKTYLSPLQVGKYEDMTKVFMDKYPDELFNVMIEMLSQKKRMKIIGPAWDLPVKSSGVVRTAVVVGGNSSKEVLKRFKIVRDIVGKNTPYYTCDSEGSLIKVDL